MKILKSRLAIGAFCLVLAAIFSFVILPKLLQAQRSTTTVVRLSSDIEYGTEITSAMISKVEVGAYGLPGNVITDAADVIGKIAASKLYAADYLTPEKLMEKEAYEDLVRKQVEFSNFEVLVTVTLPSPSSGVAGVLMPGDYVDAYQVVVTDESDTSTAVKVPELEHIRVYDVMNKNMVSLSELTEAKNTATAVSPIPSSETAGEKTSEKKEGNLSTTTDLAPAYVVFAVSKHQAGLLLSLENDKSLRLVYNNATRRLDS